ncbi:MAG TPA: VOC family protein [Thermodesulfobacteriota bacterium]|nr:VOC family protein [Thermodesulfobacteriota bacterium]
MFKRIDHVEIVPSHFEKTIEFYMHILNFKLKERRKVAMSPLEEIVYLELNGTVVELMSVQNAAPLSEEPWRVGYHMIALEVEDMDRAIGYLRSKGVEISWGPVTLGNSKRAEIKDPNGLSIELRQW